ncbi:hypothetical protein ACIQZB_44060 [Streptomyces sp. NPDC097727]|uniref:hypothetical protein n=1 Tax=Streptomyces sp. NPDC097727 TaxID=3366092 RepID=UPI00382AC945
MSQLAKLTASETHRLDRAIVAISVNPELGTPVPDTLLRDYVDDVDGSASSITSRPFDGRLSRVYVASPQFRASLLCKGR